MVVKYKVSGIIEVDLDKYEIKELQANYSETMKKAYLEELLQRRLSNCEMVLDGELSQNICFDELYVESDWDKYVGNMSAKNEKHGSPLAISLEDLPTTDMESVGNTMKEIANRKKNKKH